jgi:hypothetical protein
VAMPERDRIDVVLIEIHGIRVKALTPAGLTRARQVFPLTPPCRPDNSDPNHAGCCPMAALSVASAPRFLPGFTTYEQTHHSSTGSGTDLHRADKAPHGRTHTGDPRLHTNGRSLA